MLADAPDLVVCAAGATPEAPGLPRQRWGAASSNVWELLGGEVAEIPARAVVKTKEQQAVLMLHRTRQLLVRQRTMLSNALRGHLAELGIVSAKGRNGTASCSGSSRMVG